MRIREKMYELIIEYNSHYAVICDSCFSDTPEEHESKIYGLIDHLIANGVTIEAEPVRHGRWIYDDVDSGDGTYAPYLDVHCDKCGFETGLEQGQYGWTYGEPFPANYCPNCGAKMDGDSHDTEG